jgi:DNA-binding beta-propeller fold protein YncE
MLAGLLTLHLLAATGADTLVAPPPVAPAVAPDSPTDTLAEALPFRLAERGALGGGTDAVPRLVEPAGIATDAFGRVVVTDAATNRLVRYDASGAFLDQAGSLGSEPNQFRRPGAAARLGSLGVAVLDVENRRVITYDLHGRLVGVLVDLAGADLEARVGRVTPVALAADRGGALYVADGDGDRILAFDFAGTFVRTIGSHGEGPGRFRGLAGLAVGPRGILVACDRSGEGTTRSDAAGRVKRLPAASLQWLDAGGQPQGRLPRLLVRPVGGTRREGPFALAVDDSGRVAAADEAAGTVEVVSLERGVLARLEGLARPLAVAFAPDGTLLVAEAGAGRVRRFALQPAATGR